MPLLHILAWIWSLPTELIGLLLLPFYGPISATWFEGRLLIQVSRIAPSAAVAGQTWGRVIYHKPLTSEQVLTHEMDHSIMCDRLGPLWLLAYSLASLISFVRGTGIYEGNWFEVHARAAAAG